MENIIGSFLSLGTNIDLLWYILFLFMIFYVIYYYFFCNREISFVFFLMFINFSILAYIVMEDNFSLALILFYIGLLFLYLNIKTLFLDENKGIVIFIIYGISLFVILFLLLSDNILFFLVSVVVLLALMLLLLLQLIYGLIHTHKSAGTYILGMFLFLLGSGNTLVSYLLIYDADFLKDGLSEYLFPQEVLMLSILFFFALYQLALLQKNEVSFRKAVEYADHLEMQENYREQFLLNAANEMELLIHRINFHSDTFSFVNTKEKPQITEAQHESLDNIIRECKKIEEHISNMFLYLHSKNKTRTPLQDSKQPMTFLNSANTELDSLPNEKKSEDLKKDVKHLDYMEIKKMQEEIDVLEKSRRDLYTSISHDLRTPLTSVKGYVEAILEGVVEEPAQQQEYLKRVKIRVDGLIKLVEELSTIINLESKESTFTFSPLLAEELLNKIHVSYEGDIKSAGLSFHKIISSEIKNANPLVLVDYQKIERVFGNLISNSLRFTPAGGMVVIGVELDKEDVVFKVIDSGLGINKEDIPYLFERFYMGIKNRASATGNSGLGLAIAKEIVEFHKGKIWVDAKQEKGTAFYFKLPRYYDSR